jgi:hypothetical protein
MFSACDMSIRERQDKAPGGPCHRFTDRFRIPRIIFICFDRGLYKLGRHERRGRPMRTEAPCPIRRASTGFHPKDEWRQRRDERQQRFPRQAFCEDDMPCLIHPYHGKHPLGQIHPSYARMLFHRTRLRLNGMISPHSEIILAHRSHSAKAGPLH